HRQMENFADFVAHSHSWYKHLPLFPPGAKFHFFIYPYAAFDHVTLDDGRRILRSREKKGTHYSALPTAEHHRRFGPLAYSTLSPALVWQSSTLELVRLRLPQHILDCGAARLTAVVHTLSGDITDWHRLRPQNPPWPEESGGPAAFDAICTRSKALHSGAQSE